MKFKILSLLLVSSLMFHVGCSSSSDDEATDVEAADAADTEAGDEVANADEATEETGDEVAEEGAEETDDFATDEEVVADTGDEESAEEATTDDTSKGEVAATEELPEESMGDSSQIVAEDGTAGAEGTELADGSVSETPPAEEGVFDNSSAASTEAPADTSSYAGYEEAPKYIPVKKIADAPFKKNGVLLNTVYLARQGDDLGSISQKIWGSDNSAELLKGNPNLSKGVKVGDKVYYNSPKRPQDAERMLTYYEDNGLPAQSYIAKSGDNIRTISKNLLGDSNSWKEVWATNMAVDSKDELAEGTELKYWPDGSVAAPVAAAPATPPPAPQEAPQMPEPTPAPEAPVAANDAGQTPPAPQDDFALPDDMANAGAAAGTVANEPPPPPPPPTAAPQKAVASNDEKDLTFMLSAGGLLLVGVGVLLGIIRKGRARKMSMNTHTQI